MSNLIDWIEFSGGSGAITLAHNSSANINNSIFWGNNNGFGIFEPSVSYSLIQGIEDTDPLFVDPSNGDYSLQAGSPCIDTGNPSSEYNDTDGSRNDMGAYGGPKGSW